MTLEEVVETNLIQRRTRSKRGNVATDRDAGALRAVNHDGSIPTHPRTVGAFNGFIAWELRLVLWADGVYVVGSRNQRHVQLQLVAATQERLHDLACAASAVTLSYCIE